LKEAAAANGHIIRCDFHVRRRYIMAASAAI